MLWWVLFWIERCAARLSVLPRVFPRVTVTVRSASGIYIQCVPVAPQLFIIYRYCLLFGYCFFFSLCEIILYYCRTIIIVRCCCWRWRCAKRWGLCALPCWLPYVDLAEFSDTRVSLSLYIALARSLALYCRRREQKSRQLEGPRQRVTFVVQKPVFHLTLCSLYVINAYILQPSFIPFGVGI